MAEQEINPLKEAQHICREYLSKRGWTQEWRRTMNRQLYPGFQREEFEAKQKQCDQMEEEAEEIFSRDVERWRQEHSPQAKEILETIVQLLGKRRDLGFFAKRIIDRLKKELNPF